MYIVTYVDPQEGMKKEIHETRDKAYASVDLLVRQGKANVWVSGPDVPPTPVGAKGRLA